MWIFSCIINPESTGCGFGTVISPYLFGATASLFDVMVFLHRYIPDQMSGSRLLYNRFDRRQRNHLTDMIYHLPDRQYCGGLILLKMGKVMKKIIFIAYLFLLPYCAFATDKTDDSFGGIYTYYDSNESQSTDTRFFIEYDTSIFSTVSTKGKLEGLTYMDTDTISVNGNGSFAIGADFDGIQLAFSPSYLDMEDVSEYMLNVKVDIPFMSTALQPFVSLSAGFGFMDFNIDNLDIDTQVGFGFGLGAGIKYTFNDNMYIKAFLNYSLISVDVDLYDITMEIKASSWALMTGLGYRF